MREVIDEASSLESTTVGVYRTAATVKGGRRFSFAALVVIGDRSGRLGVGYGKANQVPPAIEKAQKDARRKMRTYPMQGRTIPHEVTGRFGACIIRLVPAAPGAGVIAGAAVRAPLEVLGIQDCLTKSFGSNNPKNLVKAVVNGLEQLRSKELVQSLRGVELGETLVEAAIKRGESFMAIKGPARTVIAIEAPKSKADAAARGGRRGRGGPGRGGGGRGRGGAAGGARRRPDEAPAAPAAPAAGSEPAAPQAETPPAPPADPAPPTSES
jgi:small subunit ribosomal protein S5